MNGLLALTWIDTSSLGQRWALERMVLRKKSKITGGLMDNKEMIEAIKINEKKIGRLFFEVLSLKNLIHKNKLKTVDMALIEDKLEELEIKINEIKINERL
tara:strand:- start:514 stop:816 length:303 start_codon:yes stop_codon:yes gene_type:complete